MALFTLLCLEFTKFCRLCSISVKQKSKFQCQSTLNINQRSEFSNYLTYQPGSVGLASVGKDSEGVQFFITHTFTQNLVGRYTIFAEVVQGMDVVNQLVVGDVILKIERMN